MSILSIANMVIRRFWRLLLSLSFAVLLFGCDSHSSTSKADNTAAVQTVNEAAHANAETKNVTTATLKKDSAAVVSDNNDEGQSLIAAANPDVDSSTRRSPMIADRRADSTLQATLIGDYMGMLPCSFCDGIAITLNLFSDGSMLKTSIYENPQSLKMPLVESGVYRQDQNIITIVYEKKNIETYYIQDNHLLRMDENNVPDVNYTLSRK